MLKKSNSMNRIFVIAIIVILFHSCSNQSKIDRKVELSLEYLNNSEPLFNKDSIEFVSIKLTDSLTNDESLDEVGAINARTNKFIYKTSSIRELFRILEEGGYKNSILDQLSANYTENEFKQKFLTNEKFRDTIINLSKKFLYPSKFLESDQDLLTKFTSVATKAKQAKGYEYLFKYRIDKRLYTRLIIFDHNLTKILHVYRMEDAWGNPLL